MNEPSAIKTSLFAAQEREEKLNRKGDLLRELNQHVSFSALAGEIDRVAPPRTDKKQGGRPPYPTELMIRVLVLYPRHMNLRISCFHDSEVLRHQ